MIAQPARQRRDLVDLRLNRRRIRRLTRVANHFPDVRWVAVCIERDGYATVMEG